MNDGLIEKLTYTCECDPDSGWKCIRCESRLALVELNKELEVANSLAPFLNRLRSLFNIEGYTMPEFVAGEIDVFLRDPVWYFLRTDDRHQSIIWREVEKRQCYNYKTSR